MEILLADSHCHTLDPRLADRAAEIANGLSAHGLLFIVEISASPDESRMSLEFAESHRDVYCTVGVHPYCAAEYSAEFEKWVRAQKSEKIVAVGECGLDYHYADAPPRDVQKEVFIRQIRLAHEMKLPLVVHTRVAFDDTLQILLDNKDYIRNGLLLHCFSESAAEVAKIREHFDAYFAFGGAVTYKNNRVSRDAILAVPHDRILIETDAPYLSPEPLRGKTNEPANVKIVAEYLAKVLELPFADVARMTTENTKRFYRI